MTFVLEAQRACSANLTGSQLATAQRLWTLAGLPPVSGYGIALLAIALAADPAMVDLLSSADFDNAASVADATDALAEWRQRTFG